MRAAHQVVERSDLPSTANAQAIRREIASHWDELLHPQTESDHDTCVPGLYTFSRAPPPIPKRAGPSGGGARLADQPCTGGGSKRALPPTAADGGRPKSCRPRGACTLQGPGSHGAPGPLAAPPPSQPERWPRRCGGPASWLQLCRRVVCAVSRSRPSLSLAPPVVSFLSVSHPPPPVGPPPVPTVQYILRFGAHPHSLAIGLSIPLQTTTPSLNREAWEGCGRKVLTTTTPPRPRGCRWRAPLPSGSFTSRRLLPPLPPPH